MVDMVVFVVYNQLYCIECRLWESGTIVTKGGRATPPAWRPLPCKLKVTQLQPVDCYLLEGVRLWDWEGEL